MTKQYRNKFSTDGISTGRTSTSMARGIIILSFHR